MGNHYLEMFTVHHVSILYCVQEDRIFDIHLRLDTYSYRYSALKKKKTKEDVCGIREPGEGIGDEPPDLPVGGRIEDDPRGIGDDRPRSTSGIGDSRRPLCPK
jgi:hypothetical protein